jgi:hypothetical protein
MTADLEANRRKNGEFGNKTQSEPEDGLIKPVAPLSEDQVVALRDVMAETAQIQAAAKKAHGEACAAILASELRNSYPGGVTAYFQQAWDGDDDYWHLQFVADKDGNYLDHLNGRAAGVNLLLSELGADAGDFLGYNSDRILEDLEETGNVATIDMTEPIAYKRLEAADQIGVTSMTRQQQRALLRDTAYELGAILTPADKDEIEYKLDGDSTDWGIPSGSLDLLAEKFGSRDAAVDAIQETNAWSVLEERITELSSELLNDTLQTALNEIGL